MAEQTLNSEQARKQWSQILDATIAGVRTIVTRNGKRRAAVLPIEQYEAFQAWEAQQKEASDERATG